MVAVLAKETLEGILGQAKQLEREAKYQDGKALLTSSIEESLTSFGYVSKLFNARGLFNRMLRDYESAFKDYEEALRFAQTDEDRALVYINMADIHRVGRKDTAAAHVALDYALSHVKPGSLRDAQASDQRGLIFHGDKQFPQAIAAFSRALDVCQTLADENKGNSDIENRLAQIWHHFGPTYVELKDDTKITTAYISQLHALEVFMRQSDQQGIINCVTVMGRICLINKNYDEAIKHYTEAAAVLEKTGYERAKTTLHLHLAEAYLAKVIEAESPKEISLSAAQTFAVNQEVQRALPHLDSFVNGVLVGNLTQQDMKNYGGRFDHVVQLYGRAQLSVSFFDQVKEKFAAAQK